MSLVSLANALAFVLVGIVVFVCALLAVTRALPGDLWNEALRKQNTGASVVLAAVALALGWIVAAAVH
jgi:uncharacterized membrane protein YjfL (UPF0719 family)